MNILETICDNKRMEVLRQKEVIPLSYLEKMLSFQCPKKISFRQSLLQSETGIIAEFKRRSPSKGWIYRDADVETVAGGYEAAGAAAVSCLTDERFFGGDFSDFRKARAVLRHTPLLRKDFMVDEYQIYQSKVMGADVILLIAACLSREETFRFTEIAHSLDLEVLLEIHSEEELAHIHPAVDVVGINNRNLKTFATDIRHTIELAHQIPDKYVKISESGLSDPETVVRLRQEGFKGFLMGENFMKTKEPGKALETFISYLSPNPSPQGRGAAKQKEEAVQNCPETLTSIDNCASAAPLPCGEGLGERYEDFRFSHTTDPTNWHLLINIAKELRSRQTEAEQKLWEEVRANKIGYKIRRQHIISGYIADFVNLEKQIVIEIDGAVHLTEEQRERDEIRTQVLNEYGFEVIRFSNTEVLNNPQGIAKKIKNYLDAIVPSYLSPNPSPQGRGAAKQKEEAVQNCPENPTSIDNCASAAPLPCGEGLGERYKVKVCGMKYPHNIRELSALPIDMIGLIFYEKSPRYAGDLDAKDMETLPSSIQKTGVFVNAEKEYILAKIERYGLQQIQLHGNESPGFCRELKATGVKIIKAFPVCEAGDIAACLPYEDACDYFLFDTKTDRFGGSGEKFDWKILEAYRGVTPFFLSGGIDSADIESIRNLNHPMLYAIDLNSKFETAPGLKDINKVGQFLSVFPCKFI
jgi:indole-3-glycerol phosphate synthase